MKELIEFIKSLPGRRFINEVEEIERKLKSVKKEDLKGKDVEELFRLESELKDIARRAIKELLSDRAFELIKRISVINYAILKDAAREVYPHFEESLEELKNLGLVWEEDGYIFVNKEVQRILEDFETREYHKKAVEYYERLGTSLESLAEKSYHCLKAGDIEKSFKVFMDAANSIYGRHRCVERLIEVGEKLINKVKERDRVIGTLGNLYLIIKRYDEAESCYRAVLREYMKSNDERIVGVLNNLANLYHAKGDFKKAEETYKECLRILLERNEEESMVNILISLSSLYMDLNRFDDSAKCLYDALRIEYKRSKTDKKRLFNVATLLNNLGYVYSRAKNFENAEKFYREAVKIYRELVKVDRDQLKNLMAVLNNLSSIYINTNRLDMASEMLKEVEDYWDEIPPDLKVKLYFIKAKTLERSDNKEEAIKYYFKAAALGFLIFRNLGTSAINFIHCFDKVEELGDDETKGDASIMKNAILKLYYGSRSGIPNVKCGRLGKILLDALNGIRKEIEIRDEIDMAVYVLTDELVRSRDNLFKQ